MKKVPTIRQSPELYFKQNKARCKANSTKVFAFLENLIQAQCHQEFGVCATFGQPVLEEFHGFDHVHLA